MPPQTLSYGQKIGRAVVVDWIIDNNLPVPEYLQHDVLMERFKRIRNKFTRLNYEMTILTQSMGNAFKTINPEDFIP